MLEAMRPINRSKAGIANPRGVFDPIAAFDIYLRGGLEALSPEAARRARLPEIQRRDGHHYRP